MRTLAGLEHRPLGTLVDPGPQQSNLHVSQVLTHRRHRKTFARTAYALHELALGTLAGHDDVARSVGLVEAHACHLLPRPMTRRAPLREDRLDIPREVDRPVLRM